MPHIKSLDGLRGLSILLVLILHAAMCTPTWRDTPETYLYAVLRYGWIGVDCFFVLSGFLITTILLADRSTAPAGQYFKTFYARRALRIFPVYYLLLAVLFVAMPSQERASRAEWWSLATYTYNFYQFFQPSQLYGYVGHLWSLAIEEHFYLVWPAVVYFLAPRHAARVTVVLVLAIVLLRIALVVSEHTRGLYINTFTRADSLLMGALLAYMRSTGEPAAYGAFIRYRRLVLWGGTAVLVIAQVAFAMHSDNVFNLTLGFTLLALVFACVVSHALEIGGAANAFLEQSWLCAIGRLSYGAYLFHMPIYTVLSATVFSRFQSWREGWYSIDFMAFLMCGAAITFAVAALSFRYIERPLLALKRTRAGAPSAALA